MEDRLYFILFVLLVSASGLRAQTTHWTCNPHDYEYDMTAYVAVVRDGERVGNYYAMEVAAFCEEECRGVVEFLTAGNVVYGYLRIRSNSARGENITFKAYDKEKEVELELCCKPVTFASETTLNRPGAPLLLWVAPQSITYNLHESGIGTIILPFDTEIPDGMKVYAATDVVDKSVRVELQTSIEAGKPLIVIGNGGEYSFVGTPTVFDSEYSEGVLTGILVQKKTAEGYVLQTQSGRTAFYRVNADKPINVPAFHCWLNYSDDAEVVFFNEDLFTGIKENYKMEFPKRGRYDLQGRNASDRYSGVVIENGKKVIIKK